ncbi:MAG TPA: FtsW/RodA/SpoVE family cell cycle protein [Microthrixaceae bacterium]|nr:FtsW/RodA/SpoVE family cell cycle protein [Microthrixaceae bacterium]
MTTAADRGAMSAGEDAVARRRRSTELGLLVVAMVVIGAAYTLASLGRSASLPADIVPFLAVLFALFVAAHVAIRRLAPRADAMLVPLAALLNGLGYVFIARLDDDLAGQQAAWTAVAMVAFVLTLAFVRRVRTLARMRYTILLAGVILIVLPLLPAVGVSINGARIWTRIGPLSFQPGEFAKIALAIFFAAYLVERRELLSMATFRLGPLVMPEPKHLAPLLVAWGVSLVVMIFEKDLGSALLFFVLFITMLWVATGRLSYLIVGVLLFAAGAFLAYSAFEHVQLRVDMWLDPWQDPLDGGFQIVQATYAMAWGGLGGTGLGLGIDGRIPYQETDFIFAIIGEELGLAGATAIVVSYLLIVGRGFRVATTAADPFAKLLATGLTSLVAIQSFIIMAGVIRLLPLTGVTLPFVSYGGSSLVSNWIIIALLVRLSDEAELPALDAADDRTTVLARG